MKSVSDIDFFLNTPTSARLYHDHAANLPIVDVCCHLDISAIAENKNVSNITELWLYGDPNKWELMRVCGVDERFITGNASDFEKFREFCRIMPMLIGNPQYIACHTELQIFFDCKLTINSDNCETIWKETSERLAKHTLGAFDYVKMSGVKTIFVACSPTDDLEPYEIIRLRGEGPSILPVFSPERCFDIDKKEIAEYLSKVCKSASVNICDYDSFCRAYVILMDRFGVVGCKSAYHKMSADHSLIKPDLHHADLILKKALSGKYSEITNDELSLWKTQLMRFFGSEYARRNWVMQIECGTGGSAETEAVLSYMYSNNVLPKTVLFSNDARGCVLASEICKKLRRTDPHKSVNVVQGIGFIDDIEKLAARTAIGSVVGFRSGAYGNIIGVMHELFRKSLCNVIANWVDNGICPEYTATETIKRICYHNAAAYFEID